MTLAGAGRAPATDHAACRPANAERKIGYDELLNNSVQRAGSLFFPYLGAGMGNGRLVELADGSVKFDMIGGIGVHHFGHSNPAVIAPRVWMRPCGTR